MGVQYQAWALTTALSVLALVIVFAVANVWGVEQQPQAVTAEAVELHAKY